MRTTLDIYVFIYLNITCIIELSNDRKRYLGQFAFFSSFFLIFPKLNMAWMISQDLPSGNCSNHCTNWHKSLFIFFYTKKDNNEMLSISLQSDISLQIPNRNFLKCTQLLTSYNCLRKINQVFLHGIHVRNHRAQTSTVYKHHVI